MGTINESLAPVSIKDRVNDVFQSLVMSYNLQGGMLIEGTHQSRSKCY
jgi:hypothetical protein